MEEKLIEQMNKEADEKEHFCFMNDYLFDADLMRGVTGAIWRQVKLEQLY